MRTLFVLALCLSAVCTRASGEEFEFSSLNTIANLKSFTGGGPSNQFPRAPGVYNGLLMPTNGFVPNHSGFFRLWVDSDRDFSGRFDLGDNTFWLRGHFDRQGRAGVLVYLREWDEWLEFHRRRLVWIVRLELIPGTDEIQGTLENVSRGWSTTLFGYRGFGHVDGHAPQAGRYTLRLPSSADPAVAPSGEGYGAIKVSSAGHVQAVGALPDSTPFSRSATLSTNGWWPFFLPLNDGRGALIGWLKFNSSAGRDISGDLLWVKPRGEGRRYYPEGYVGTVATLGSRYTLPGGNAPALNWVNGLFIVSGGNLEGFFVNNVTLLPGGSLMDNGGEINGVSFRSSRSTGVFRGKFLHPNTGRRTFFSGILDQFAAVGGGFFLDLDQGGLVRFETAP
jgi:hypothetical protein